METSKMRKWLCVYFPWMTMLNKRQKSNSQMNTNEIFKWCRNACAVQKKEREKNCCAQAENAWRWIEHTWRNQHSVNVDSIVFAVVVVVIIVVRTVQIFGVEKVIKTPFEINFRDAFQKVKVYKRWHRHRYWHWHWRMQRKRKTTGRWSTPQHTHTHTHTNAKPAIIITLNIFTTQTLFVWVKNFFHFPISPNSTRAFMQFSFGSPGYSSLDAIAEDLAPFRMQ